MAPALARLTFPSFAGIFYTVSHMLAQSGELQTMNDSAPLTRGRPAIFRFKPRQCLRRRYPWRDTDRANWSPLAGAGSRLGAHARQGDRIQGGRGLKRPCQPKTPRPYQASITGQAERQLRSIGLAFVVVRLSGGRPASPTGQTRSVFTPSEHLIRPEAIATANPFLVLKRKRPGSRRCSNSGQHRV
jgi:hypothetical protein